MIEEKVLSVEQWQEVWERNKKDYSSIAKNQITYTGYASDEKIKIFEALAFWFFMQKDLFDVNDIVYKFLQQYVESENKYISIIAKLESMPAIVWRALFEIHNVDFMSPESFLRRLNSEQIKAIEENYVEYCVLGKIPPVLKHRLYQRITINELKESNLKDSKKYSRHGAMGIDMVGLGFGYHAYPHGENDDTNELWTWKKFAKNLWNQNLTSVWQNFLDSPLKEDYRRVKCPDKLFITKQTGVFASMYRNIWMKFRTDKTDIKMGVHFCPKAWATIILFLIIWAVSPFFGVKSVFLMISGDGFNDLSLFSQISYTLMSLLMPIWFGLGTLDNFLSVKKRKKIIDFFEDNKKLIDKTVSTLLNIFILAATTLLLSQLIFLHDLNPLILIGVYILFVTFCIREIIMKWREEKYLWPTRMIAFTVICISEFFVSIIWIYHTALWSFIVKASNLIYSFLSVYWFSLAFMVFMISLPFAMSYIFIKYGDKISNSEKLFQIMEKASIIVCAIAAIGFFIQISYLLDQAEFVIRGVICLLGFCIILLLSKYPFVKLYRLDPQLKTVNKGYYNFSDMFGRGRDFITPAMIRRNKWLRILSTDKLTEVLLFIKNISFNQCILLRYKQSRELLVFMVEKINQDSYDILVSAQDQIKIETDARKYQGIIRYIIRHCTNFEYAKSTIYSKETRREKIKKVFWIINRPFMAIYVVSMIVLKFIKNLGGVVKITGNKMCPLNVTPIKIDILR